MSRLMCFCKSQCATVTAQGVCIITTVPDSTGFVGTSVEEKCGWAPRGLWIMYMH